MAPQQDSRTAGDRRSGVQVAYPASLERRKDGNLAGLELQAHRKSDADGEEIELYFGDS